MKFLSAAFILITLLASCGKTQSFEYRGLRNFKVDSIGFSQSTVSMELVYF